MRRLLLVTLVLAGCGGPIDPDGVTPDDDLPLGCTAADLEVAARTTDAGGDVTTAFGEDDEVIVEVSVTNRCGNAVELVTSHTCLVPAIAISGQLADGSGFGTHYTAACADEATAWIVEPGRSVREAHRIAEKPVGKFFAAVVFSSVDLAGVGAAFEVLSDDEIPADDDDDPLDDDDDPADGVCGASDLIFSVETRTLDGSVADTFTVDDVVVAAAVVRNPCDEDVIFSSPHVCIVPAWTVIGSAFGGSYEGCHELERTWWGVPAYGTLEEGRELQAYDAGQYTLTVVSGAPALGSAASEFRVLP